MDIGLLQKPHSTTTDHQMNHKSTGSLLKLDRKSMKKLRPISFVRRRYLLLLSFAFIIVIIHYSGLLLYLSQSDLDNLNYHHTVNQPNLTSHVEFFNKRFNNFLALDQLKEEANRNFDVKTLDDNFDHRFLIENQNKYLNKAGEHENIRLLILIKSALSNRQQRDLLRKSWANERRFYDVQIRTLFSVGSCDGVNSDTVARLDINRTNRNCQDLIDEENYINRDLLQIDFTDSYYNNTIKTMNGIKWIVKNCPQVQFVLLIDDDYYLSVKNLLKHIRWLNFENEEREKLIRQLDYMKSEHEKSLLLNRILPKFDPYTQDLYSGFVFDSSVPCRYRLSKWFVNLDEYPFSRWPPCVTAGFILISNRSLKSIYFASLYTEPFRFDDIYLSILARKTGIRASHCENVHFYKLAYSDDGLEYKDTIGSHGFQIDNNEMLELWTRMKSKGFA